MQRFCFRLPLITLVGLLTLAAAAPQSTGVASASGDKVLRIATLLPRSRESVRDLKKWNRQLADLSGGKLKVRMYWGGVAGDEVTVLRKMKAGQLDGATLSTVGLGQVVRSVQLLNAPGLINNTKQLDVLQKEFEPLFNQQFTKAGFHVAGWGEAGQTRLFSAMPVKSPGDLKSCRPWTWTIDSTFPAFLKTVGANGVKLGVPEVMGALQTGMVDTLVASATVVWALQWYPKLKFMSAEANGFVLGALIFKQSAYDTIPPDLQEALQETARARNKDSRKRARTRDRKAYKLLSKRGIQPVKINDHRQKWQALSKQARWKLVGKLYPKPMLERAEQLLQGVDGTPDVNR